MKGTPAHTRWVTGWVCTTLFRAAAGAMVEIDLTVATTHREWFISLLFLPGDFVDDTPEVKVPNFGCPSKSISYEYFFIYCVDGVGRYRFAAIDSCPVDGQGIDMTWNFMDYTDDDCMDTFTEGQISRMNDMWNAFRVDTLCEVNCKDDSGDSYVLSGAGILIVAVAIVVVLAIVLSGGVGYLLFGPGHAAKIVPIMDPMSVDNFSAPDDASSIEAPPAHVEPAPDPNSTPAVQKKYHEIALEPM